MKKSADNEINNLRHQIRTGTFTKSTAGLMPGYVQANYVALPKEYALDFMIWCLRNPRPCPLIEVLKDGETTSNNFLNGLDVRLDIPLYRILSSSEPEKSIVDICDIWRPDLYSFLLGCSYTLDDLLIEHGIPVRHVEANTIVPMFQTNIETVPCGHFSGPVVVTMRPMTDVQANEAVKITENLHFAHGGPICVGNPRALGITDLSNPDFGEPVQIQSDEIPIFWACGVTTQVALANANVDFAITHAPGRMLITSVETDQAKNKLDPLNVLLK